VAAAAVAVARVAAEEGITGKHDSTTVEGGREEGKRKRMEKKMEQGFYPQKTKTVEVVVVVGYEQTNQDILEVQRCRDELYDSDGEELMGRRRMETTDGDDG